MGKRIRTSGWARIIGRSWIAATRMASTSGRRVIAQTMRGVSSKSTAPPGTEVAMRGIAIGATGAKRFHLYSPPGVQRSERLPLMVMLHGCGQDADRFAVSTRMNRIATRERFLVLYPEQDRFANAQGCWNWYATDSGRAYGEAALIMKAIDQVCLLQPVDKARVVVAGLSAGASMAALLVTRQPGRFKALVMHSGIAPGTAHSTLSALSAMRGHQPTVHRETLSKAMVADWPPLLVIHGDADAVVAPSNGEAAARAWALAAGAQASRTRRIKRGKRYAMAVTDFKRNGSTFARLVAVDGLAHAWSGGAAGEPFSDPQGPDASGMAWAFAAKRFAPENRNA